MKKRYRILLWGGGILLVLVALFVAFSLYDNEVGFGAPAHPNFTGYRPTVLPSGVKVSGQSLTRFRTAGMDDWEFVYQIKLSAPAFNLSKVSQDSASPRAISCQGLGNICNKYTTPKGISYIVWYGEYKGRPFDLQVQWLSGNTHLTIAVNGNVAASYIKYNWAGTINSMQAVDLHQMAFKHVTENGSGG